MKAYPLGIQTFEDIINGDFLYIDKTEEIYELTKGRYYFYARPRRFGKSLMLSTIKSIYEGKKELFKGVNTITLFNSDNTPILERLFFNDYAIKNIPVEVSLASTKQDSIRLVLMQKLDISFRFPTMRN